MDKKTGDAVKPFMEADFRRIGNLWTVRRILQESSFRVSTYTKA